MNRTITVTAALLYYDGVQVFEATDSEGKVYVGTLVPAEPESDCRYLVVEVPQESLEALRGGKMDLLAVIEGRIGPWFTGDVMENLREPLSLVEHCEAIPDEYLPLRGVYIEAVC